MQYITFNYMYRDYSNYKNRNTLVFSNPNNLSLGKIDKKIHARLVDGQWFHHKLWNVPDMHFEKANWYTDHPLHEYKYVETCVNPIKVEGTIDEFLEHISKVSNKFPVF